MHELIITVGDVEIKKIAQTDEELKRLIYLYNGDDYFKNEALYNKIIHESKLQKDLKE